MEKQEKLLKEVEGESNLVVVEEKCKEIKKLTQTIEYYKSQTEQSLELQLEDQEDILIQFIKKIEEAYKE